MDVIKFDEIKKTWRTIARHTTNDNFTFELEVHKKLLDIFNIGNYYYYVFNVANAFIEMASPSAKAVLGLTAENELTVEHILNNIHPEDLPYFMDFEAEVGRFFSKLPPDKVLKYKVSYDYRIRRQNGGYIRVLQQTVTIQTDEQGAVIRVLGVHTDITHLNKPQGSTLSFIGLDGEPSYNNVITGHITQAAKSTFFTRREKEILQLLLTGKTSQEIAETLFISKLTVDGHRKNMLKKTNCTTTFELTMKALQQNWVVLLWIGLLKTFLQYSMCTDETFRLQALFA